MGRLLQNSFSSRFFSYSFKHDGRKCILQMKIHSPHLTTRHLPNTVSILHDRCPSVLNTKCYNDRNLTFAEEVKATEIGHLFEHLLLDILCKKKIALGKNSAHYSGDTAWNWTIDPRGTFTITVGIDKVGWLILPQALEESSQILENIYQSAERTYIFTNHRKRVQKTDRARKLLLPALSH